MSIESVPESQRRGPRKAKSALPFATTDREAERDASRERRGSRGEDQQQFQGMLDVRCWNREEAAANQSTRKQSGGERELEEERWKERREGREEEGRKVELACSPSIDSSDDEARSYQS